MISSHSVTSTERVTCQHVYGRSCVLKMDVPSLSMRKKKRSYAGRKQRMKRRLDTLTKQKDDLEKKTEILSKRTVELKRYNYISCIENTGSRGLRPPYLKLGVHPLLIVATVVFGTKYCD